MKVSIEKTNQRILQYGDEVLQESKCVRPLYPIVRAIEVSARILLLHKTRSIKNHFLFVGMQKRNGFNAAEEIRRKSNTEEKIQKSSYLQETCSSRENILFSVTTICARAQ